MSRSRSALAVAVLALAPMVVSERAAAQRADARSEQPVRSVTEPRFAPFIGCWRPDSVSDGATRLRCVAPIANSADVEIVDLLDGQLTGRRRVAASGRPTVVEDGGCRGEEQASWSPLSRRVYLHGEFVCAPDMKGTRTTLMSILPSGEWLEVERIRSGDGAVLASTRWRDAGVPSVLPRDVATRVAPYIGTRRLAVVTARADAAAPLTTGDVLDALRHTDTAVVREWLVETGQFFRLKGDEVAALVRAGVPTPVLQAMLSGAPAYQLGNGTDANGRSTNAYLGAPVVGPAPMAAPVIVYENTYMNEPCCRTVPGSPVYAPYYYYYAPYPAGPVVRRHDGWPGRSSGYGRDAAGGHAGRPAPPRNAGKPVGVRPQPSGGPSGPRVAPRPVPSRPRP